VDTNKVDFIEFGGSKTNTDLNFKVLNGVDTRIKGEDAEELFKT
jgi:hypothetical protein